MSEKISLDSSVILLLFYYLISQASLSYLFQCFLNFQVSHNIRCYVLRKLAYR